MHQRRRSSARPPAATPLNPGSGSRPPTPAPPTYPPRGRAADRAPRARATGGRRGAPAARSPPQERSARIASVTHTQTGVPSSDDSAAVVVGTVSWVVVRSTVVVVATVTVVASWVVSAGAVVVTESSFRPSSCRPPCRRQQEDRRPRCRLRSTQPARETFLGVPRLPILGEPTAAREGQQVRSHGVWSREPVAGGMGPR